MRSTVDGKTTSSFGEAVSSDLTGRTSATGLVGVLTCMLSLIIIVVIMFYYFLHPSEAENVIEFIDRAIIILGIGTALLGTRKVAGIIGNKGTKFQNILNHSEELGQEIVNSQQQQQQLNS